MATNPLRSAKAPPGWVRECFAAVALTLVGAWAAMLLFGVLHHEVSEAVPALGWWTALTVNVLSDFVIGCWLFGTRVKLMD